MVTEERDPRPIVSIAGVARSYVERVVHATHEVMERDRLISALTHVIIDETTDRDALLAYRPENSKVCLQFCAITQDVRPEDATATHAEWAQSLGRTVVYLAASPHLRVLDGCPRCPLVVAESHDRIRETARVWIKAAVTQVDGRRLPLSDLGTSTRDQADVQTLASSLHVVRGDVLSWVRQDPTRMHDLSPLGFEEFVCELLAARGFAVTLTPYCCDGGKDILAVSHPDIGDALVYVECKKWAPTNPVGPEVVRSLYGVVAADNVAAGVLATTSTFTAGAKDFQRSVHHRLSLRDFVDLSAWLSDRGAT